MGNVRRRFAWLLRPQLFVGFIVACLCIGALGNVYRSVHASPIVPTPKTDVKGAHTNLPSVDCQKVPCIALTFDDGPDPQVTPRVLDTLAAEHIKATFFVVGRNVAGKEDILRRMHREGHEIGNHSWDHADFTKLSPAQVDAELASTQSAISAAGVPAPRLFRPPYGAVNDMVKNHANMTIVRWDIDPEDWLSRDPVKINESLLAHARPGGIILMHDIYPSTADALTPAIDQLKTHYQFVTASQLMSLSAGDQGQFFGRR
jgi:peptidoglycan/xylan/chitin deacetylase (PgdA/CDA1 family)